MDAYNSVTSSRTMSGGASATARSGLMSMEIRTDVVVEAEEGPAEFWGRLSQEGSSTKWRILEYPCRPS